MQKKSAEENLIYRAIGKFHNSRFRKAFLGNYEGSRFQAVLEKYNGKIAAAVTLAIIATVVWKMDYDSRKVNGPISHTFQVGASKSQKLV